MASRPITLTKALELSSRVVKDDDALAEPLIELILGLTDDKGDAMACAIRSAVLKNLYCQTADFRTHFRNYVGEELSGVIDSTSSAS